MGSHHCPLGYSTISLQHTFTNENQGLLDLEFLVYSDQRDGGSMVCCNHPLAYSSEKRNT
jgi:hypothetical protein